MARRLVRPDIELVGDVDRAGGRRSRRSRCTAPDRRSAAFLRIVHLEVADVAVDLLDLGVGEQRDVRVLRHLDHPRRQDALRAVERREGLGELAHVAADGGLLLDQDHLVAGVGDVERRLDAGDAAADDQRPARDRHADGLRAAGCAGPRRTAMREISMALAVASSRSLWTQEQCSRMLAISHRKGLRPARSAASRKVFSCMCGEQQETTTPSSLFSLMAFMTAFWPGSEHMYL